MSYADVRHHYEEPEDPDPPGRMRCRKGHFLSKNPQVLLVEPKDKAEMEEGPYRLPFSEENWSVYRSRIIECQWKCRCGSDPADE